LAVELNEVIRWIVTHGLALLIGGVVILFAYRLAVRAVHRIVPSVLQAQASHLPADSAVSAELDKRIATIEDLSIRLLRVVTLAVLGALVLGVFELWTVLAGIAVIIVALLFATQDVVLDYVMGFLNLVEGPYFKGDWVRVGGVGGVEGTVEEIGLRRTVLRDATGSVHAVSNGLIRQSSNLTRVFSVATVDMLVPNVSDLDRAIEVATDLSRELQEDPAWATHFPPDMRTDISVTALGIEGASLRIQLRVLTGLHGPVASELRRRLASALVSASIGTGRFDTPQPITNEPMA
jgi:small-conductance mechanosensitive channel